MALLEEKRGEGGGRGSGEVEEGVGRRKREGRVGRDRERYGGKEKRRLIILSRSRGSTF